MAQFHCAATRPQSRLLSAGPPLPASSQHRPRPPRRYLPDREPTERTGAVQTCRLSTLGTPLGRGSAPLLRAKGRCLPASLSLPASASPSPAATSPTTRHCCARRAPLAIALVATPPACTIRPPPGRSTLDSPQLHSRSSRSSGWSSALLATRLPTRLIPRALRGPSLPPAPRLAATALGCSAWHLFWLRLST